MEKDKLTVRWSELNDFQNWVAEKYNQLILDMIVSLISDYKINHFNSESSIETGTLEANEAKEKVCSCTHHDSGCGCMKKNKCYFCGLPLR